VSPDSSAIAFAIPRSVTDDPRGAVRLVVDEEVRRRHVAVQHPVVVQDLHGPGRLRAQQQRLLRRAAVTDAVRERPAVGEVHDEVGTVVVEHADVVHPDHPVVGDAPQQPCLGQEPFAHIGVGGPVVGQHLDRDGDVEFFVVGQPDGSESSRSDPILEPVAPDAFPGCDHRGHPLLFRRLPVPPPPGGVVARFPPADPVRVAR